MAESDVITVDGGYLEGGGQILRMSVALSAISKVPIIVDNIRKGRSKPGLGHQHLTGIKLVAEMCGAVLKNGSLGSTKIHFTPNKINAGEYFANCQTAGSVSLVMQAAYPLGLIAQAPTYITINGGTNAIMAPPVDYTDKVFRSICKRFGVNFSLQTQVRGFFPKGGGQVDYEISPVGSDGLKAIELLDPGTVKSVNGISLVAGALPIRMAHQMADAAINTLKSRLNPAASINIERIKEDPQYAVGSASTIILWAETDTGCIFGGSKIGDRNLQTDEVGNEAAEDLLSGIEQGACVDPHAQDQIIILMSLANGKSRVRVGTITEHTKTAIYVAELLTKSKFNIIEKSSTSNIIECEGMGFRR